MLIVNWHTSATTAAAITITTTAIAIEVLRKGMAQTPYVRVPVEGFLQAP
jgi:hypothetical protein